MQIVTDSGADVLLPKETMKKLGIHIMPLSVTLDGKTYQEGIDIENEEFYSLLEQSGKMPTTSQPSAGDFAALYRELAKTDPDILSIHISSGLSGTINSARAGSALVPEANVTHFDALTLSGVVGWMVEAAGRAVEFGWAKDQIVDWLEKLRTANHTLFTLNELKYLINGGRISHIKGLVASLLNIKPMIGVNKVKGNYEQLGQTRTFSKALDTLVNRITRDFEPGSAIRVQVIHASNPDAAGYLREKINGLYKCSWMKVAPMSLVLGAHTGRSMVGIAYAPEDLFRALPWQMGEAAG